MQFIRSLIYYFGSYGLLVPHAILCVISGIFLPLKIRYKYFLLWNAFNIWWLSITCGVKLQVSGRENIPDESFILLSNHQSPWETIYFYWFFRPICATLKKELLRIPFFGWALNFLDPIAIDRSKKGRALQQVLDQGQEKLKSNISVLIFPEGTRVAPGVEKKFSAGGVQLAILAGRKILPVAHNAGVCWPAHKIIKHPGTIKVVIGTPIDPAGRNPKEVIREIETWIRQAT